MLLTDNKDIKSEPITCSMKAFVRNLSRRISRLLSGTARAQSHGIIQPEPLGVLPTPGRGGSRTAKEGRGDRPAGGPGLGASARQPPQDRELGRLPSLLKVWLL